MPFGNKVVQNIEIDKVTAHEVNIKHNNYIFPIQYTRYKSITKKKSSHHFYHVTINTYGTCTCAKTLCVQLFKKNK